MRYADKIQSMIKGKTRFDYSFMEKAIETDPEYIYSLLFSENGVYNNEYKFNSWIIEKLVRSLNKNSYGGYEYDRNRDFKITKEQKETFLKNIAQSIAAKFSDKEYNKKLISLFSNIYNYIDTYIDISTLPILELMEKGYTFSNSCLDDFYEFQNGKNIHLLFLMLNNSVHMSGIFQQYINTLNENDILELVSYGYEIDSEALDWYMSTHSEYYDYSFSLSMFNILVENSIIDNKTVTYEKLFTMLIYENNLTMLEKFDYLTIDLNAISKNEAFSPDYEKLNLFILKSLDLNIFTLLVENGYTLDSSFFSSFLDKNIGNDRVRYYVTQVDKTTLLDTNKKNVYYTKAIDKTFSSRLCNTYMFELLNQIKVTEIFEYGIQLLLEKNDIVFLLNKIEAGYIPTKNVARMIGKAIHGNLILNIIEKRYSKVYNQILPFLF